MRACAQGSLHGQTESLRSDCAFCRTVTCLVDGTQGFPRSPCSDSQEPTARRARKQVSRRVPGAGQAETIRLPIPGLQVWMPGFGSRSRTRARESPTTTAGAAFLEPLFVVAAWPLFVVAACGERLCRRARVHRVAGRKRVSCAVGASFDVCYVLGDLAFRAVPEPFETPHADVFPGGSSRRGSGTRPRLSIDHTGWRETAGARANFPSLCRLASHKRPCLHGAGAAPGPGVARGGGNAIAPGSQCESIAPWSNGSPEPLHCSTVQCGIA